MCGLTYLDFMRRWKFWIRPFVIALYVILLVILLPILIINAYRKGFNKSDQGELIGGLFVVMAIPISVWQIVQHMVHYNKPFLQKHIIRVLWMVPIYALNAWLGLAFPAQSIYMDSLRECYEAYVIYNFMVYLLNYLNSETNLIACLELKPQVYHFFPLCCMPPWEMGRELVHMCKHGILQYTVVRPLTTAISFLCELNGVYGEGEFRGDVAFPYMIFINNLSQFVAMYCLVLFYRANKEELSPMKPVGKFLCIKAVVFFSFFQGVLISILVYTGVISSAFGIDDSHTTKLLSSKLQDFLICIEMFLAAIAHHYSFTYKAFIPRKDDAVDMQDTLGCWDAFAAMWDVSDVHRDLREHFGVVGSSLSRTIRGQHGYKSLPTENSSLLVPTNDSDDSLNTKTYSSVSDYESAQEPLPTCSTPYSQGSFHPAVPTDLQQIGNDEIPTNRREIDVTAKEAEKYVPEAGFMGPRSRSGHIPVHNQDSTLIDYAPEISFSYDSNSHVEKT